MSATFTFGVTIEGHVTVARVADELRRVADNLEGNIASDGRTASVVKAQEARDEKAKSAMAAAKSQAPSKTEAASKTEDEPAAKAEAPAKAKAEPKAKATKKPPEKLPEDDMQEEGDAGADLDDEFGFDEGAGEDVELTLGDHVMPAFKAFITKRAAKTSRPEALAEVAKLMRGRFNVESGRVSDLPSKHFKAALEAIK